MLVGYARVSTENQNLDKQIDILIKNGVNKRNIYFEKITGTKKDRPELIKMLKELEVGDILIVQDITRLSRSTKDLLATVETIKAKGCFIKSIQDSWLDTSKGNDDPQTQFLLTVMSGLSQLETDLISRRTKESLAASRKRGIFGGRPKMDNKKIDRAIKLYEAKSFTVAEISQETGVSKATLYRYLKDRKV
jgi:DNA invertase Pin-like site-specific DNA recombinase